MRSTQAYATYPRARTYTGIRHGAPWDLIAGIARKTDSNCRRCLDERGFQNGQSTKATLSCSMSDLVSGSAFICDLFVHQTDLHKSGC
jgi:hypothetical protein